MNIVIVGAGAIGLLLYKRLDEGLESHHRLSLLARSRLNQSKMRFTDLDHSQHEITLNIADTTSVNNADIIIICVKAFQVHKVLLQQKKNLKSGASIVLCHNGMGVYENMPSSLAFSHPTYALITTHGSKKEGELAISHTGNGQFDLGLLTKTEDTNNVKGLLLSSLKDCSYSKNIVLKQWQKLAINCVINPITAIYQIKNGDVVSEKYQELRQQLISEFVAIAALEGFNFKTKDIASTIEDVANKTANNTSSMLSDIVNNRKTEISYINGYLMQIASKHHKEHLARKHQEMCLSIEDLTKD